MAYEGFHIGDYVIVRGLMKAVHLNGRGAIVTALHGPENRLVCKLIPDALESNIKTENLDKATVKTVVKCFREVVSDVNGYELEVVGTPQGKRNELILVRYNGNKKNIGAMQVQALPTAFEAFDVALGIVHELQKDEWALSRKTFYALREQFMAK